MHAITRRLSTLEHKANPAPSVRNVILTVAAECSPADEALGLAEAHAAAGADGRVVIVHYVETPRPPWWTAAHEAEQVALRAQLPARPPYTIT